MTVPMKHVTSSNISAWGYDAKKKELHIEFKSGGTYIYSDVPKDVAEGFEGAESAGKYFHSSIKNNYEHAKV